MSEREGGGEEMVTGSGSSLTGSIYLRALGHAPEAPRCDHLRDRGDVSSGAWRLRPSSRSSWGCLGGSVLLNGVVGFWG